MGKKTDLATITGAEQGMALELNPVLAALEQQQGQGLENASREDYAIPFLNVLQALSPQVQRDEGSYVEGAQAGDIFNTVLKTVHPGDVGIEVIPVYFEKQYNEWVPRDAGGGFVASYASKEEAHENVADGNDLIDTALHYVLYRAADNAPWMQAVLSMTSTKLKVSRNWVSRMASIVVDGKNGKFTPPTFGQRWHLYTVRQENNKGKFYNLAMDYLGLVSDIATLTAAKQFRTAVMEGVRKVDHAAGEEVSEETAQY